MSDSDDEVNDVELKAGLFAALGGTAPSIKAAPAARIIRAAPAKRHCADDPYVKHEINHGGRGPFIGYIYIASES